MKPGNRLIAIISIFALSMVFIHRTRAPQRIAMISAPIACLPVDLALQQKADAALARTASFAHTTLETTGPIPAYRCYFNLPHDQVPCVPKGLALRNKLKAAPSVPALSALHKKCYFLESDYRPLHALIAKKPPISYKEYNGKIVKSVEEAKKLLGSKK